MMISAMNLKISPRRIITWVIWGVVVILLVVFLARVISFENYYYHVMEGTERAATIQVEEDLIEEEPSAEEVESYMVAADRPRYLTIEKLGINKARILAMGVEANGALSTPRNIFDVGWYEGSGKPGAGGTLVIDGHNGGPHVKGVFKNLPSLAKGDVIIIERGDGEIFRYKVVENEQIPLDEADNYMKTAESSPEEDKESVTLISCSGEWSDTRKTYLSRQFVRAVILK